MKVDDAMLRFTGVVEDHLERRYVRSLRANGRMIRVNDRSEDVSYGYWTSECLSKNVKGKFDENKA